MIQRLLLLLALSIPAVASVTNYVQPATQFPHVGSYQTCTSVVSGQNDKTVTWAITSSPGGSSPRIVGTNPSVANEPSTVALFTTTAGNYTLTATTNTGAVAASCVFTFSAAPTATIGHPRFLVTSADLAGLQAKSTAGNTTYQNIVAWTNNVMTTIGGNWPTFSTWNGSACVGYVGPTNPDGNAAQWALAMAWRSMSEGTVGNRDLWGCRAHDLWVYIEAALQAGTVTIGVGWSDQSDSFSFIGDWLLTKYLVGTEKSDLHTFLYWFAQQVLSGGFSNGCKPVIGSYNSVTQTAYASGLNRRCAGSNYTQSRMMLLTAIGLTFDDNNTDDPALTNTCSATRYVVCSDGTAGSLHAYWNLVNGTMLYTYWGHIEPKEIVQPAYNAFYSNLASQPNCTSAIGTVACFGDGRGGESTEANWYGLTMFRSVYTYAIIHSAGYDDPTVWGPQVSGVTSSFWDMYAANQMMFLMGNVAIGGSTYYPTLNTGDTASPLSEPYYYYANALLMAIESHTGRTDNTALLEWPILYTVKGGLSQWNANAWRNSGFWAMWPLFVALGNVDPTASPPADPRPNLPLEFYTGGDQHGYVRTGWGATDSMVSNYAVNTIIDHEHGFSGRPDVIRKGEAITAGRTEFTDYNNDQTAAIWSNLVAITNNPVPNPTACGLTFTPYQSSVSGQWWHNEQAGYVTPLHSELPTYSSWLVNQINQYNTSATGDCPGVNDVTIASRDNIWLKSTNQLAIYDRTATGSARSKILYLNTTGTPSLSVNTFSWNTVSGTQKAYFTSLLPASPTFTATALTASNDQYLVGGSSGACFNNGWCDYLIGGASGVAGVLKVDAGSVTSAQFLHVLEWGDSGLIKTSTTLVSSSGGQTFDGALIGTSLVVFMRSITTFTGVTYPASTATTQYVSDLSPNTTYTITGAGTPANATSDNAGIITFSATGTGNITIGASSQAATPTALPLAGTYFATQSVTLSTTTGGATICYTTNGLNPTASSPGTCDVGSTTYSGAITVAVSTTIKAIATETGFTNSTVGTFAYTILPPPPQGLSGKATLSGKVQIVIH